jgi:hypothetical protein
VPCCQVPTTPLSDTEQLAFLLLSRDEFAHGEQGSRRDKWTLERREVFNESFRCRFIQAQLAVSETILDLLR